MAEYLVGDGAECLGNIFRPDALASLLADNHHLLAQADAWHVGDVWIGLRD